MLSKRILTAIFAAVIVVSTLSAFADPYFAYAESNTGAETIELSEELAAERLLAQQARYPNDYLSQDGEFALTAFGQGWIWICKGDEECFGVALTLVANALELDLKKSIPALFFEVNASLPKGRKKQSCSSTADCLRAGDIIVFQNPSHAMVVLEKTEDGSGVLTVQGNVLHRIVWGTEISFSALDASCAYIVRLFPQKPLTNSPASTVLPDAGQTASDSVESDCPCAAFEDMPESAEAREAISWAYNHKPYQITAGIDATHFGPEKTVTRAQAMVFFWAAKDRPAFKKASTQFVDVKKTDWYYKAVMWAVENGITAGTDATHFSPNKICNRGEILGFLYAAMKKPKVKIANPYKDVTNQWYRKAALWAYANGIEKGENGKFNASTPCTRTSTATYLYRFFEQKSLLN